MDHHGNQADNFIIDTTNNHRTLADINNMVDYVYRNPHTDFVNTLMIVEGDRVIDIFKRNGNELYAHPIPFLL